MLLVLLGCGSCGDPPTGGDDIERGDPLLRHPQESGAFLYYQDIGGNGRINGIYRINLSDSVPQAELLVDRAMFPAVSPSGTKMAYVKGGLYMMDLATREAELIGSGDVLQPKWLGEDTLVFELFAGKIYIVDVNVKDPVLEYEGFGSLLDISPSGVLAFADGYSISTVRLHDSERVDIFAYPNSDEFVADGDWSPDEDELVFEYWRGIDREVRVIRLYGPSPIVQTIAANGKYPAFSENEQRVLYVYIDPGRRKKINGQIWIVNVEDASDNKPLTTWEMMRH